MQRKDLVLALADMDYYKSQADTAINDVFRLISETLINGEKVTIRGFGSFEVKERKGHLFSDPRTKELRTSDDYLSVVFKPGDNLKSAIRERDPSKLSILNRT